MADNPTFTLSVERTPEGQWFITSPELPGFMVAELTLLVALQEVPRALDELWAALTERRHETGVRTEQYAIYEALFVTGAA